MQLLWRTKYVLRKKIVIKNLMKKMQKIYVSWKTCCMKFASSVFKKDIITKLITKLDQ